MKGALSKVPVLRILLPFILGIILASFFYIPTIYAIILIILSSIAYIFSGFRRNPIFQLSRGYLFKTFSIIIFIINLGVICHNINTVRELTSIEQSCKYAEATILEINDKDFSTHLQLHVFNCIDSSGKVYPINHKMTAWIEENNYSLIEGDIIFFHFNPLRIKNKGNPEEMNYERYMKNNGFLYHTFITKQNYKIIGHHNNIFSKAKNAQRYLINLILSSTLQPEAKTFFITILLGNSSLLQHETRNEFSHAGIAHILALSGLHVTIITFILGLILFPLDWMGYKRLRLITTLILIIIFSFVIGLPISVIRATTMISFIIIAKVLRRSNISLNALFFSALSILIFNPLAIYDIGFQFSFVSVLLILLLSNKFRFITPKKEILHYVFSLLVISVITSIGTMWFTAYYFNYISLFSVFSNIIIIPILPLIIFLGIISVCFLSFGTEWEILTQTLNSFYNLITSFSYTINTIPYSYIDNLYISTNILWFTILSLSILIIYIYKRKVIYLYTLLILIVATVSIHYIEQSQTPNSGYVILNENKYTPIISFSKNQATIFTNEDSININLFKQAHRNFLAKYNINELHTQPIPKQPYMILGNKKISVIQDNTLKQAYLSPKINIHYLIITKGYYGNIKSLTNSYKFNKIILSGDIYHKRISLLKNECDSLGIQCHTISEQGSIYDFFNI